MRSYLLSAFVSVMAISTPLMAATPAEQLQKLFRDSDETSLKRNPINALFRGDLRYADQLGDFYSDAQSEANYQANKIDLAALAAIDPDALSPKQALEALYGLKAI